MHGNSPRSEVAQAFADILGDGFMFGHAECKRFSVCGFESLVYVAMAPMVSVLCLCTVLSTAANDLFSSGPQPVYSLPDFLDAIASSRTNVEVHGTIVLTSALHISASTRMLHVSGPATIVGDVVVTSAMDITIHQLYIQGSLAIADTSSANISQSVIHGSVRISNSSHIAVARSSIHGGLTLVESVDADVGANHISNANGTCVQVASCGNATTFETCNITIHDNYVSNCRAGGGSPYAPGAQGILLGGVEGHTDCTVGVVIRNNDVRGVDEMAIRINNDNYGSCVNNLITLNRVADWGQLPKAEGGDTTDSGCLYVYGHWFSPGNVLLYNECISTNASWGQNGVYLDDAATGQIVVGNIFRGAVAGSPIKLNGGAFNTIHSNLVIGGVNLGFGNCRGLRGTPALRYTCANYPNWLAVLENNNYLSPPWSTHFPWYAGWCTNTTAGPQEEECAPPGSPDGYCCEVLSRGNSISRLAGVWMNASDPQPFHVLTAPGFPTDPQGDCPQYVVNASFNSIDWSSVGHFYDTDQFVNASAGDYTLRPDSAVYVDMPDFVRVPYTSIGTNGHSIEWGDCARESLLASARCAARTPYNC